MPRSIVASFLCALLVLTALAGAAQAAGPRALDALAIDVPTDAQPLHATAFEFRLPAKVAAVDGRVYFDKGAAEIVGLAPVGGGTGFRPIDIPGGIAFGAYGLRPTSGRVVMRVVIAPLTAGRIDLRVVIDAAADKDGNRLSIKKTRAEGRLAVRGGSRVIGAPAVRGTLTPSRASGATRELVADGRINKKDLDNVRAGWELARSNEAVCGAGLDPEMDANGDGCVDIVDVQALIAAQGQRTSFSPPTRRTRIGAVIAAASAGPTFVVDSTADTPDLTPGDGLCLDASGNCTLRSALTESNWWSGPNRIEFNLPGTAPVRIQLSGAVMPNIQDRSGGVTIDGYTQPGSQPNTAAFGTNAIPGVEIRGTRTSPTGNGLRITSPNNTVRGLLFNNIFHGIVLDHPDARNNRILGNWLGFNPDGSNHSYRGDYLILIQGGSSNNILGTPNLADRNYSGRARKGVEFWGAGTNNNIVQNNVFCTNPLGGTADCNVGIDLDHGPTNNLIGGTAPNERNVTGRTTNNGIEMSHGFSPDGSDHSVTWQVNSNRIIGNWVGFRPDGSYDAAHRSAQNNPGSADNGNGINAYDGSNNNLIEGNWVASVWDGIQTMSSNSTGTIIRNNIIGESPLGQPAPLTRWGIVARLNTRTHLIQGNIIRNAPAGGIGLTQHDVRFVRITRNIVTDTVGPAIYLAPNPGIPTTGANNLQPAPVITSATTAAVQGTGANGATVEVYRASRPAGQSGLPIAYLGAAVVGGGTWSLPVSLSAGDVVTALQIVPNGNTSALGTNVLVTFVAPPPPPVADFDWSQQSGSLTVQFTDTSTGSPTSWGWNFGDGGSSTQQNPSHTYAAAGDYTVTLTASNAGGPDGETQTITVDPLPPPGVFAVDAFGRSLNNSWGSADVGGAYTLQGNAADFDVGGGVGTIALPTAGSNRAALLNGVSQANVDITFRVASDKVAAGGRTFVYALARRNGNNEYRGKIVFNEPGTVAVHGSAVINNVETALGTMVTVPGLTQAPGSFFWVRVQVTGTNPTTVRVKAWADGNGEPAAWQYTATNSAGGLQTAGGVGVRAYLASAVSNAPVLLSVDGLAVNAVP